MLNLCSYLHFHITTLYLSSNIIPQSIYYQTNNNKDVNNTNQQLNVLAIVASIAVLTSIGSITDINAHTPNFLEYGELNHQEDQLYFKHDGMIYINAVISQGNGLFMAITDINQEYTVNEAIDRFGIHEDSFSFVVEPSIYSTVGLVFQFNDETLTFQLLGAIEV